MNVNVQRASLTALITTEPRDCANLFARWPRTREHRGNGNETYRARAVPVHGGRVALPKNGSLLEVRHGPQPFVRNYGGSPESWDTIILKRNICLELLIF